VGKKFFGLGLSLARREKLFLAWLELGLVELGLAW